MDAVWNALGLATLGLLMATGGGYLIWMTVWIKLKFDDDVMFLMLPWTGFIFLFGCVCAYSAIAPLLSPA